MRLKILNITESNREMLEGSLLDSEMNTVSSEDEAIELITSHFGTLKCKSDDYDTDKGQLWIVYPPKGVCGEVLNILISPDTLKH